MNKEPDSKEMHRLFLAKADGTITDEEHARLSLMLHGSVSVRSAWFAFQDAEAALLAWAQRETLANHAAPVSVSSSGAPPALTRGGVLKFFGALAAGIAIAGAPFLLGLLGDSFGISRAYIMVFVLIIFAFAIVKLVPSHVKETV